MDHDQLMEEKNLQMNSNVKIVREAFANISAFSFEVFAKSFPRTRRRKNVFVRIGFRKFQDIFVPTTKKEVFDIRAVYNSLFSFQATHH